MICQINLVDKLANQLAFCLSIATDILDRLGTSQDMFYPDSWVPGATRLLARRPRQVFTSIAEGIL
jgi:hypothetical protein